MACFINGLRKENGQGLSEYGLILAILVVVAAGAVALFGPKVLDLYITSNNAIN